MRGRTRGFRWKAGIETRGHADAETRRKRMTDKISFSFSPRLRVAHSPRLVFHPFLARASCVAAGVKRVVFSCPPTKV